MFWNKSIFPISNLVSNDRPALLRLEDITAGNEYIDAENLEKLQVIADYLFSINVPFHIAWIPRFIDPPNEVDNDISRDFNFQNTHFLFTLEYLLNRNGIVGLHGYTHQYGHEVSGIGTEFNKERNNDEESIRMRIDEAINTAQKLELPYSFFESPHYASTAFQQSIFEDYFNILYEDYVGIWNNNVIVSPRNHNTLYVPTPLGYVEEEESLEKMLKRINMLRNHTLASLFYHPYIELDYIILKTDATGYPLNSFDDDSPIHRICEALYNKSCSFSKVTQLSPN
jgi:hypothetical protein